MNYICFWKYEDLIYGNVKYRLFFWVWYFDPKNIFERLLFYPTHTNMAK